MTPFRTFSMILCASVLASASLRAQELHESAPYDARDRSAAEVTAETLYASETFWPRKVTLLEDVASPEGKTIEAGDSGFVIHLTEDDQVRVDFGRVGKLDVPLSATDAVERANKIRLGEESKPAPNFAGELSGRLVDSESDVIQPIKFSSVLKVPGFLAVYSEPAQIPELARALEALHGHQGVWTVLFLQGRIHDLDARQQLRDAGWAVPFMRDELSDGFTRARLGGAPALPALWLLSPEGRILWRGGFDAGAADALRAAIDTHFATNTARLADDAGAPADEDS